MDGEEWRPYPLCDKYLISNMGRVRSVDRRVLGRWGSTRLQKGRLLKLVPSNAGYLFFGLCDDGKQSPCYVHRAVLLTFVGERQPGQEACHNNGDRLDNRLSNLRWDTRRSNAGDRIEHDTQLRGERHRMAKLSDEKVRSIRSDPRPSKQVAADFGVHFGTVCTIRARKTWTHVE